ncbi:Tripartite motif-containing protein 39, partial [Ophiophagus hannah]
MASSVDDPVERLQEEVSCSICLEYLRDPVTIDCGHNFCQACISDYCKGGAGSTTGAALCPQCRVGFLLSSSRPNKQLANIVEGIERLARRPSQGLVEALCEKHGKKLRLFCQDDGESICLLCDKSREHRMHSVLPIEEAAHDYKMKLQEAVDILRKTLAEATKLENKVKKHRTLIVLGFEKRRQAMAEEEKLLLKHLQEEELGTLKKLERNSEFLLEQCAGLQNLITEMEHKCQEPAAMLLKDLLSVQVVDQRQDLPKSSFRFETCTCLMGREQFTFGKHYWVVCVESKSSWTLGVCKESVSRQGIFTPSPATGFWTIWLRNGDEYAALTSPLTELVVRAKPKLVGIFLDYDAGEVSFYNSNTGSHIFTFLDSFSETLRPYFYPGIRAGGLNDAPLIIQPAKDQSSLSLLAIETFSHL